MSITIGSNLKPLADGSSTLLSKALAQFISKLSRGSSEIDFKSRWQRVFAKAGAPSANTAADSPGQDLCFIVDTTNNDLYLVYNWTAANSFSVVKILDL